MIRRPPRSTQSRSSAASDVYKRQEPDIVCLAKGIASGLPLGAFIARAEQMSWPPGSHGSTFGGNPIACAAGLATLDLIEDGLMENASKVGAQLQDGLREIAQSH